jgi:hypothetical protein
MMLPVKSSTIPAITRTTAAIHKMKVMSRFMHPAYPRLLRFTPAPAAHQSAEHYLSAEALLPRRARRGTVLAGTPTCPKG